LPKAPAFGQETSSWLRLRHSLLQKPPPLALPPHPWHLLLRAHPQLLILLVLHQLAAWHPLLQPLRILLARLPLLAVWLLPLRILSEHLQLQPQVVLAHQPHRAPLILLVQLHPRNNPSPAFRPNRHATSLSSRS
jgi:hypothetical protein